MVKKPKFPIKFPVTDEDEELDDDDMEDLEEEASED